jgi:hypothetical protein
LGGFANRSGSIDASFDLLPQTARESLSVLVLWFDTKPLALGLTRRLPAQRYHGGMSMRKEALVMTVSAVGAMAWVMLVPMRSGAG